MILKFSWKILLGIYPWHILEKSWLMLNFAELHRASLGASSKSKICFKTPRLSIFNMVWSNSQNQKLQKWPNVCLGNHCILRAIFICGRRSSSGYKGGAVKFPAIPLQQKQFIYNFQVVLEFIMLLLFSYNELLC